MSTNFEDIARDATGLTDEELVEANERARTQAEAEPRRKVKDGGVAGVGLGHAVRRAWLHLRLWLAEIELSRLTGIERGMWHYRHARAAQRIAVERLMVESQIAMLRDILGKGKRWPTVAKPAPIKVPKMRVIGGGR